MKRFRALSHLLTKCWGNKVLFWLIICFLIFKTSLLRHKRYFFLIRSQILLFRNTKIFVIIGYTRWSSHLIDYPNISLNVRSKKMALTPCYNFLIILISDNIRIYIITWTRIWILNQMYTFPFRFYPKISLNTTTSLIYKSRFKLNKKITVFLGLYSPGPPFLPKSSLKSLFSEVLNPMVV
jgi:hypothetical protein